MSLADPRKAERFRFVRRAYADGVATLVYAFDDGPEMIERILFPNAPALPDERRAAFEAALDVLHLVAGVSYYKAGVPPEIVVETHALDEETASFLEALYLHGLGEFAYHNKIDLRGRIAFLPPLQGKGRGGDGVGTASTNGGAANTIPAQTLPLKGRASTQAIGLARRTLVPIGGGKDSLVSVEILK